MKTTPWKRCLALLSASVVFGSSSAFAINGGFVPIDPCQINGGMYNGGMYINGGMYQINGGDIHCNGGIVIKPCNGGAMIRNGGICNGGKKTVPETGSTVALLGLAIGAAAAARRFLR